MRDILRQDCVGEIADLAQTIANRCCAVFDRIPSVFHKLNLHSTAPNNPYRCGDLILAPSLYAGTGRGVPVLASGCRFPIVGRMERYREAVAPQSPGLLQPWENVRIKSNPNG